MREPAQAVAPRGVGDRALGFLVAGRRGTVFLGCLASPASPVHLCLCTSARVDYSFYFKTGPVGMGTGAPGFTTDFQPAETRHGA